MRGHVVGAFGVVDVFLVAIGRYARKDGLQVTPHIGVGVLAEDQRGAGVLQEDGAQALLDAAGGDDARDLGGDVGGAAAFGAEGEGLLVDHRLSLKPGSPLKAAGMTVESNTAGTTVGTTRTDYSPACTSGSMPTPARW